MKDKIVSFILILIIVAIIVVLGIFGYTIYVEITGNDPIQINFEGYGDLLTTETNTVENTMKIDTNKDIFSGIEDKTTSTQPIVTNTNRYRHLYEQLNSTAKTIYDKLYENSCLYVYNDFCGKFSCESIFSGNQNLYLVEN